MTDLLRQHLRAAPSLNAVAKATGLQRAALSRFAKGRQSLRLDLADRLAAHFGVAAVQQAPPQRKRGASHGL